MEKTYGGETMRGSVKSLAWKFCHVCPHSPLGVDIERNRDRNWKRGEVENVERAESRGRRRDFFLTLYTNKAEIIAAQTLSRDKNPKNLKTYSTPGSLLV